MHSQSSNLSCLVDPNNHGNTRTGKVRNCPNHLSMQSSLPALSARLALNKWFETSLGCKTIHPVHITEALSRGICLKNSQTNIAVQNLKNKYEYYEYIHRIEHIEYLHMCMYVQIIYVYLSDMHICIYLSILYMHIYTYICVCMYKYIYICIYTYIHHISIYLCIYI